MFTYSSHTAQQLLADLNAILDKEQARQVLIKLQPLIDDQYFKDVTHAIIELMPEVDMKNIMKEAIERSVENVFEVACSCVSAVTGVMDIQHRRTKKTDELLSRYYVLFIMCEELHVTKQVTYGDIGALFVPPMHHTVIIHSRKVIENYLHSDEHTRRDLANITRLLAQYGHWRSAEKVKSVVPLKSKHIEL